MTERAKCGVQAGEEDQGQEKWEGTESCDKW